MFDSCQMPLLYFSYVTDMLVHHVLILSTNQGDVNYYVITSGFNFFVCTRYRTGTRYSCFGRRKIDFSQIPVHTYQPTNQCVRPVYPCRTVSDTGTLVVYLDLVLLEHLCTSYLPSRGHYVEISQIFGELIEHDFLLTLSFPQVESYVKYILIARVYKVNSFLFHHPNETSQSHWVQNETATKFKSLNSLIISISFLAQPFLACVSPTQ